MTYPIELLTERLGRLTMRLSLAQSDEMRNILKAKIKVLMEAIEVLQLKQEA